MKTDEKITEGRTVRRYPSIHECMHAQSMEEGEEAARRRRQPGGGGSQEEARERQSAKGEKG